MYKVKLRWIDGRDRHYDCKDLILEKDHYLLKSTTGKERRIPKEFIRLITIYEINE